MWQSVWELWLAPVYCAGQQQTKDGKMWDGQMTVDEFKKNLDKKTKVSSLITGLMSAVGIAVVSGLTLLLRGKIKA